MSGDTKEDVLFRQRMTELCNNALDSYSPAFTAFLDGRQKIQALEVFGSFSKSIKVVCYGGFKQAQRVRIGLFPLDVYGWTDDENEFYEMFDVSAIEIKGSGFSSFGHRDVMGSVLGLGIKRDVLGDIYLPDDKTAYICLTSVAAQYICSSLEAVARDKVKTSIIDCKLLPEIKLQFSVVSGTVASDRLDCIVSLCTGLSREKAKQIISSANVNLNHFEELRCDIAVCDGDVLSVRGYGRFVVHELGGLTKKGRTKATVHKMI